MLSVFFIMCLNKLFYLVEVCIFRPQTLRRMFFSGKIKHIEQFSRRDSFHEFEKFPYFDTHSIHLTLLSSIFPLLFSKIETENVICQSTKFLGKKWGIGYPPFPLGFTSSKKHNLLSKSSQIISWESKKRELILILSCI